MSVGTVLLLKHSVLAFDKKVKTYLAHILQNDLCFPKLLWWNVFCLYQKCNYRVKAFTCVIFVGGGVGSVIFTGLPRSVDCDGPKCSFSLNCCFRFPFQSLLMASYEWKASCTRRLAKLAEAKPRRETQWRHFTVRGCSCVRFTVKI